MFKFKSVATRLLLVSCLSAVSILAGVVAFIDFELIPKLTDRALANQTSAMARALMGIHERPEQWTEAALARESSVLDAFSNHGKAVATLFLLNKDGQYVRVATTLFNAKKERAVGSVLDPDSPAYLALKAGREYSGYITLFNRPHMSSYVPIAFANGTRGAVFVGVDYSSADSLLLLARQMNYVAVGVGLFGIALLGIGLFFSIRVERNHREIDDIMRTTQAGLFLLDTELKMGSQASGALSGILGFEAKEGDNFLELLKPSVSPKTFETAQEYIDLLLRHDIKEKLVASLNPLECIEIAGLDSDGSMVSRFLQIRFNRVFRGKVITHLLVTANDITRQVRLEQELRESERRVQDQMSMMVNILQADPASLREFLGLAVRQLNQINECLRTSDQRMGISQSSLESILRCAHQTKGDASALQLDVVAESLHALETLVHGLQNQPERKSEDLLPVAVRVKELYTQIGAIQDVIAKIDEIRGSSASVAEVVSEEVSVLAQEVPRHLGLSEHWNTFAQKLAARHGKQVELQVHHGVDVGSLAVSLREALNSLVNQFIRNALVHGVEDPEERKSLGKPEIGQISVHIAEAGNGMLELIFKDDGRGLDLTKIRQAAIRSGHLTSEQAEALGSRELISLIFESGLSTRDEVDEDAGRGIGMNAAKDLIQRLRGRIRIESSFGKFCHFCILLPLQFEQENA